MSEQGYGFVRLPAAWIRTDQLKLFYGGEMLGTSVTALKLFIAIVCATRSDETPPGAGRARLTFSVLEERASVARAMIPDALTLLQPWIRTTHVRTGNVYEVVGFTSVAGEWVKMPAEYIVRTNALAAFTSRSPVSLAALKLYLYLLERRERGVDSSKVSYAKIRERTGIQQNDIPRAISALSGADLIRWKSTRRNDDTDNRGSNTYYILGLNTGLRVEQPSNQTGAGSDGGPRDTDALQW